MVTKRRVLLALLIALLVLPSLVRPSATFASERYSGTSGTVCDTSEAVVFSMPLDGTVAAIRVIQVKIVIEGAGIVIGQWKLSSGAVGPSKWWQGPGTFFAQGTVGTGLSWSRVNFQEGTTGTARFTLRKPATYGGSCFTYSLAGFEVLRYNAPGDNGGGGGGGGIATPTPNPSPTPTPTQPSVAPSATPPPGWCENPDAPDIGTGPYVPCEQMPSASPTPSPTPPGPDHHYECVSTYPAPGDGGNRGCIDTTGTPSNWVPIDGYEYELVFTFTTSLTYGHNPHADVFDSTTGTFPSSFTGTNCIDGPDFTNVNRTCTTGWQRVDYDDALETPYPNVLELWCYTWGGPSDSMSCSLDVYLTSPAPPTPTPSPTSSGGSPSPTPPAGWETPPTNPPPGDDTAAGFDVCDPQYDHANRANICQPEPSYSIVPAVADPDGIEAMVDALEERAPFGYAAQAVEALSAAAENADGGGALNPVGGEAFGCFTFPLWQASEGTTDFDACVPFQEYADMIAPIRPILVILLGLSVAAYLLRRTASLSSA